MYFLILTGPLLGALGAGALGRRIGERGAVVLTTASLGLSLLCSYLIFYETILNSSKTHIKLWKWLDLDLVFVNFGLQFDSLTAIMLIVVSSVSTLVHLYSSAYMSGDPHVPRFMAYLSLFTFFMLLLVTSDNFPQLFIGWEGVGLCSYLLVNYWWTRMEANKAALKAMLVNRIGDMGFVIAMLLIWNQVGCLDFAPLFNSFNVSFFKENTLICFFLLIGVVGKSAQIGLHTWLPDAMEGPTPVSALIHAATMVTAGVFLLIRAASLFEQSPLMLMVIATVGATTAFVAATASLVQNDLKKVIAFSTCSQLGYMVMACGLSQYSVSLFHLTNHAFFKALLFLGAGSVIHSLVDEQDMRRMGGFIKPLPLTYSVFFIGSLSIMGFPYLTGFYSKDLILELAYQQHYLAFAYWLGVGSALLTAAYSFRLLLFTFVYNSNTKKELFYKAHESASNILIPLGGLALGSIFVGYFMKEVVWSFQITNPPFVPFYIKGLPITFGALGCGLAMGASFFYKWKLIPQMSPVFLKTYTFFSSAWQFNFLINHFGVKKIWETGHFLTFKVLDKGALEKLGPQGITQSLMWATRKNSALQSGLVYNYALIIMSFVCLCLLFQ